MDLIRLLLPFMIAVAAFSWGRQRERHRCLKFIYILANTGSRSTPSNERTVTTDELYEMADCVYDGSDPKTYTLKRIKYTEYIVYDEGDKTIVRKRGDFEALEAALQDGPLTKSEVMKALGLTPGDTKRLLDRAVADGRIEISRSDPKTYTLKRIQKDVDAETKDQP